MNNQIYLSLSQYIAQAETLFDEISEERKEILTELADYISNRRADNQAVHLNFICTHNSRRSHLSQIWAYAAAHHFGVADNLFVWSGGTEATAFNPRAVAAVERAGFKVANPGGDNPKYQVYISDNVQPLICFSKKYDDAFNPKSDFAAIMTCSDADANCPIVFGANKRLPIRYEDPKISDGTAEETATYDARCRQIAIEMTYAMSLVK